MSGTPFLAKNKVYIIAEAGVNHNGDITKALRLVDEAKNALADAVKFQTFIAYKGVSKNAKMADYQKDNIGKETSQLDMLRQLELSFADFVNIKEHCDNVGIQFLSTPFDYESVDFIENIVPFFKIGSGEITNYPFLKHVAKKKKPIILSTGMSTLAEVEKAIEVINKEGCNDIVLLHCTTNYPCPYNEVNLNAMQTIKKAFKLPIGYSDHTLGIEVPIAAVAMGANVIEKHFTLDKDLPGPDHKASLDPQELTEMVKAIRNIESALGDGIKRPNKSELEVMSIARKSLVAARDMSTGEIVKESDIAIKRPGNGIKTEFLEVFIGKKLLKDVKGDELLTWECFFQS